MVEERKRIRTWQEIADYLDVSVATAKKWTRELKLPVFKVGDSGAACAYCEELEKWYQSWRDSRRKPK